tara:strand:+ start:788 stop:964 length:177 start_codon:yes stop_codon:yes gene_type:complete
MEYFYVETRSVSDPSDYVITKTRAESKRAAVDKIKAQDRARGVDNRDNTYTINPQSNW